MEKCNHVAEQNSKIKKQKQKSEKLDIRLRDHTRSIDIGKYKNISDS
jgi:hypothetical protein